MAQRVRPARGQSRGISWPLWAVPSFGSSCAVSIMAGAEKSSKNGPKIRMQSDPLIVSMLAPTPIPLEKEISN